MTNRTLLQSITGSQGKAGSLCSMPCPRPTTKMPERFDAAYHDGMENDPAVCFRERVAVRVVRAEDAETVAALSTSLGYPATAGEMRARIEELADSKDRRVLAAVFEDALVGWVDAAVERHLQSDAVVVIGGLVVRDDLRGKGIGQQMCRAVEEWAVQMGIATVRVRSQVKRADAHRFYLRDGYAQVKVSAVFEKRVLHGGVNGRVGDDHREAKADGAVASKGASKV